METKSIREDRAIALIRWGRNYDQKIKALQDIFDAEREASNTAYMRTLRKERVDLHDEEAENLMSMCFSDWLTPHLKPRVPIVYSYGYYGS